MNHALYNLFLVHDCLCVAWYREALRESSPLVVPSSACSELRSSDYVMTMHRCFVCY